MNSRRCNLRNQIQIRRVTPKELNIETTFNSFGVVKHLSPFFRRFHLRLFIFKSFGLLGISDPDYFRRIDFIRLTFNVAVRR